MSLDFTLDAYRALVRSLGEAGYRFHTFSAQRAARGALASPHALLRHDVDRLPRRAHAMARLEHEEGVAATYFFRTRGALFQPELIASVRDLGHEIGYHYECLADTGGDLEAAWRLFRSELARFAPVAPVAAIAMHGRPLSRWDSRELWSRYDYREAGVALEAYLDIDWSRYAYFTDTGRRWDGARNVRDFPPGLPREPRWRARRTGELLAVIRRERPDMVLSAHPERWAGSFAGWLQAWSTDAAANTVKLLLAPARRAAP
ncbi:MAG: hypothetical protein IT529_03070 [Burkholderiales bacterium]|nr:hypothetical protein [Burkholderiales bacterium]